VSIKLQQDPEIRVESDLPNFLVEIAAPEEPSDLVIVPTSPPPPSPAPPLEESPLRSAPFRELVESYKQTQYFNRDIFVPTEIEDLAQALDFKPAMDRLLEAKGRGSFETRTGFTVIGTDVARAIVTESPSDLFQEANAYHIRVHMDNRQVARSALIQFENGNGVTLAVLPEFIGAVVVEGGRAVSVNYTPALHTNRYSEYEQVAGEIEKRRAFVAVAARHGSFHIERERATEYADYLRVLKSFDPTLGLYAAYAYAQAGMFEQVESVYNYMNQESGPIPFDVALLASQISKANFLLGINRGIAPFCPMLTQGWALLEPLMEWMPDRRLVALLQTAHSHLVPALWTTFRPEAVDLLWQAIENGEIR
jgi:hypothetical protein